MRRASPLVALAGAAVLIVSLWLPWFELDLGKVSGLSNLARDLAERINRDLELTGWEVYDGLDFVLAVIAGAVVVAVVVPRVIPREIAIALAVVALVVLVLRAIDPPGGEGLERRFGLFLAIAGAALMVLGTVARRAPD